MAKDDQHDQHQQDQQQDQQGQQDQQHGGAGDDALRVELERTKDALRAANREAADRRRRLDDLERAEQERQQLEMSELDRAKAEVAQARQEADQARATARDMLIRAAFVSEAAKAGVAHPEDVYLLADKAGVDIDEGGKVGGVAEAVKALVDAGRVPMSGKPKAPGLDGGAGGGDRHKDLVGKLAAEEIDAAKKMGVSPEAYAKRKAERLAREQQ